MRNNMILLDRDIYKITRTIIIYDLNKHHYYIENWRILRKQ
jgi:hypothetical protein